MARFTVALSPFLVFVMAVPLLGQSDQSAGRTDYSTGNIHISIPIRNKSVFKFNVEINSHLYLGVSTDGVTPAEILGGTRVSGNGGVGATLVSQYANMAEHCNSYSNYTLYTSFNVVLPDGVPHPMPASFQYDVPYPGEGTSGCVTATSGLVTTDGSGITVVTTTSPWVAYDKSGNKYTLSTPSATLLTSASVTDPNGNVLSATIQNNSYTPGPVPYQYTDIYGNSSSGDGTNCGSTGKAPCYPMTVLYGQGTSHNQTWYEYYDENKTLQKAVLTYETVKGGSDFQCGSTIEDEFNDLEPNISVPASFVLPDGQTYDFQYESQLSRKTGDTIYTGRISQITYPGGGTIQYVYSGGNQGFQCTTGVVPTLTITRNDNNGNTSITTVTNNWTTLASNNTGNFSVQTTNNVDTTAVYTTYYSGADPNNGVAWKAGHWPFSGLFPTETVVTQGGVTLSKSITCYNTYAGGGNPGANCPAPTSANMPVNPITASRVFSNHDNMGSTTTNLVYKVFDPVYGVQTAVQVYDWGTWGGGTLLTTSNWSYGTGMSCTQVAAYIHDKVCIATVTDGVHTNYRYSYFTYDGNGNLLTSNKQLTTGGTFLTTTYAGYSYGFPATVSVAGQANTTFTYGSCGGKALTKVVFPISTAGNTQQVWDCNGGVVTSATDQNSHTTTFGFDSMWRLSSTTYPDDTTNDKDTVGYSFSQSGGSTITTIKAVSVGNSITTVATLDGFLKSININTTDPNSSTGNNVDTVYDALGRTHSVSNRYFVTGENTYGLTTYTYDALGRVTNVSRPDSSAIGTTFTGRDTRTYGLYSLNVETETDGAGRTTVSCSGINAGAQANGDTVTSCGLLDVTAHGFPTVSTYNQAGDLLSETMSGSGHSEVKSFAVDLAGRVTSQTLPESGTELFTYDSPIIGQLSTHKDARSITTTYTVDAMYRTTGLTFSDSTPSVTYAYDTINPPLPNQVGRLAWEGTTVGGNYQTIATFAYDVMGRLNAVQQCAPLSCSPPWSPSLTSYTYDFAGNRLTLGDTDTQNTLTYGRNSIGQLTTITPSYTGSGGDNVPSVLFGGGTNTVAYNAFGKLTKYTDAGSVAHTLGYDKMGRLTSNATTAGPYSLGIQAYNADGNVTTMTDSFNGNWQYTYDSVMGRLTGATCTSGCPNGWGTLSWTYDEFGNRWTQTASSGPNTMYSFDTACTLPCTPQNHMVGGVSYDAAGNMTNDGFNTYTFDAKDRISTINGTQSVYVYDASGNRVETQQACCQTTDFIFDGSSILHTNSATFIGKNMRMEPMGQYSGTPGSGSMLYYIHYRDQVESLREESKFDLTAGQIPKASWTNLPFGDALTKVGGGDTNASDAVFFGDMFEDTTAGQGGIYNTPAREAATIQGRWLSPDPAHDGWNAYVYGANNPVTVNDPTGLYVDGHPGAAPTDLLGKERNSSCDGGMTPNYDPNGDFAGCAQPGTPENSFSSLGVTGATAPSSRMLLLAQNQSQTQTQQKPGEEHKGDPYSLKPEGSTPDGNNGAKIVTYQVVDPTGRPVTDVSVQEHVKVVAAENVDVTSNPNFVHYPTGQVRDQVGPTAPSSNDHSFLKTEQTFTAQKGGNTYEMSTKVNQYVNVSHGDVTVQTVVIVP